MKRGVSNMKGKKVLVIGGSSGAGREIALCLAEQGADTTAVARKMEKLEELKSANSDIKILSEDASKEGIAERLLSQYRPDILVLCVGHAPPMTPFFEQTWEEFSGAWNVDTKIAHEFMSAAITLPMVRGGTIVSFSSGAGLSGSRLSGGYAGAKRMQHFLSEYAQREAELHDLSLKFYSLIPKQLIADTDIGMAAGEAYANANNISISEFMNQWDKPLTAKKISKYVLELLNPESDKAKSSRTFELTGTGFHAC